MNRRNTGIALLMTMIVGALSAWALKPTIDSTARRPPLRDSIPLKFGRWTEVPSPLAQVALTVQEGNEPAMEGQAVYDEVITRTYQRDDGARVMLAVAYSRKQRQERKIHRPELCYYSQGYKVSPLGIRNFSLSMDRQFKVRQLMASNRSRLEPVTYWIRIGDQIPWNQLQTRWIIFSAGMQRHIPDGILVRASSLIDDKAGLDEALALQQNFLIDLYSSISSTTKGMLTGA